MIGWLIPMVMDLCTIDLSSTREPMYAEPLVRVDCPDRNAGYDLKTIDLPESVVPEHLKNPAPFVHKYATWSGHVSWSIKPSMQYLHQHTLKQLRIFGGKPQ